MRGVCLSREAWLSVGDTFFFFGEGECLGSGPCIDLFNPDQTRLEMS